MRGKIVPVHCAAELPQGADHSSPASFQSYFIEWLAPWPTPHSLKIGWIKSERPFTAPEQLHSHRLHRHIMLDVILFKKRNDLRNVCSNADVQKLMFCNLSPVLRNFWLKPEW